MDDKRDTVLGDPSSVRVIDPVAFAQQVMTTTPLAQAVVKLLGFVLHPPFLEDFYERQRGRSYQDVLTFAEMVQLLCEALLVHQGSARKALLQAQEQQRLSTTREAFYGKLRRIPIELSVAFLVEASQRLCEVMPPQPNPLPECFHGYDVMIVDGKKTKHVAKRLLATRGQAGQLFGAKLLVAYDPVHRLIRAMAADADGERNDCPLIPALLPAVRRLLPRPRLWVSDAQFCDLVQMTRYRGENDHFLVRHHPKLHFHADAQRPAVQRVDAQGRSVIEEWGWVGSPKDQRRCYVRRVTWKRSTHKDLVLVTDLLEGNAVSAEDLILLYLTRWRIETVFQQVTELFGLKKLIGSTAQATAFQAAFCMVVYNLIGLVRSYVAVGQAKPLSPDDVSMAMLFDSIRRELVAVAVLIPAGQLSACVSVPGTAEQAKTELSQLLTGRWQAGWRKASDKKPRQAKPPAKRSGAHTSVYRLQQKHKLTAKPRADDG